MSGEFDAESRNDDRSYERSRKRSRSRNDDRYSSKRSNSDSMPLLKILVPSYAAGAIIGKKGADIHALKNDFGVNVEISKSGNVYPGTDDRIMVLTGEIGQINDAHDRVIDTVHNVATDKLRNIRDKDRGHKIVIICPNKTAGLVIGRGGADIKELQEETKAKIVVIGRDDTIVFGERTITISGGLEERKDAAQRITSRIAVDAENRRNHNLSYSDGPLPKDRNMRGDDGFSKDFQENMLGNQIRANQQFLDSLSQNPVSVLMNQIGGNNSGGNFGRSFQNTQSSGGNSSIGEINTRVTIEMEIPIAIVGFLLGGDIMREFMKFSGADIQILPRNDFNPSCPDRVLTIRGNLSQSQTGYFLVNQKVTQLLKELGQSRRL